MEKNPNSWRLIAMFFAIAMLFALGSIQGSPKANIDPDPGYIFDMGPPAVQQIVFVGEATQPILIARGVSVPIRELTEMEITIMISTTKNQDYSSISDDTDVIMNNFGNKKNTLPDMIYWQRAREKI